MGDGSFILEDILKIPAVYIMANKPNGTIYTGVTSNLIQRTYQHREGLVKGFTCEHNCKQLVFYEIHETMESAITREKKIKNLSRANKVLLIIKDNPNWNDLYLKLF